MARTQNEINNEYGASAAQLGQEVYLASLAQEQIAKHEYNIEKLKSKMQNLAKEALKLNEALKAEVPEVATPAAEVSSEQA